VTSPNSTTARTGMPSLSPPARTTRPGLDRRAERWAPAAPIGAPRQMPPVTVVGGGIAGLAAATVLAERGAHVTILEAEDTLGGRVRSWPVTSADGQTLTMSRGFHAFFRQYYNLRALLRRADPDLRALAPVEDYPLVHASGQRDSFAKIPRQPPLNVMAFVARSPSFRWRDLLKVDVAEAMGLLDVDFPATFTAYDGVSAAEVLDRLHFPASARHLALEVFARSFFADPREFSGGEMVGMFHTYFLGSSEGLLFDCATDDFDTALWAPLAAYLQQLGVEIRTGVRATALTETDGGILVHTSEGTAEGRTDPGLVVLALPTQALQSIVTASPWLGDADWRERISALRAAPPFGVLRRWLARPVADDSPPFLGTAAFGPLDNISRFESLEAGAKAWADATGGTVIELHAYAMDAPAEQVKAQLWDEYLRLHPESAGAPIVHEEWLVHEDCPLVDTSPWERRPTVQTPDPRVTLAGDLVRCDLPIALMERAATTGMLAANALLASHGHEGQELWSVPTGAVLPGVGPARTALTRLPKLPTLPTLPKLPTLPRMPWQRTSQPGARSADDPAPKNLKGQDD
jgi:isorenieratene synthase